MEAVETFRNIEAFPVAAFPRAVWANGSLAVSLARDAGSVFALRGRVVTSRSVRAAQRAITVRARRHCSRTVIKPAAGAG